jgi:hypothetical protein
MNFYISYIRLWALIHQQSCIIVNETEGKAIIFIYLDEVSVCLLRNFCSTRE